MSRLLFDAFDSAGPVGPTVIVVPFLDSTGVVFQPSFRRRPDAIVASLTGRVTPALIYPGAGGQLVLSPLPDKDARTRALLALRQLISLVTFRRTVAPGESEGQAFRVPLDHIFEEMPDDVVELRPPTIGFLPIPGPGVHESLGTGVSIYEDTLGDFGVGTALASYGELVEPFTVEVVAEKKAHRRGIVAGLQSLFRLNRETNTLWLAVPDLFGATAEFVLTDTLYIDDPYVVQNRRRAYLHVTLTVPELFIAHGLNRLKPSVFLQLGSQTDNTLVLEPSKVEFAIDPNTGELLFDSQL